MRRTMVEEAQGKMERGLALALALGAQAAKLAFSQTEERGVAFESGRLKSADAGQGMSYHIEALAGGRRASTTGNDMEVMEEMVRRAVELARAGAAAHFEDYPAPGEVREVKTYSEATAEMSREGMIEACEVMVKKLAGLGEDLFIEADAHCTERESVLVTSGGVRHVARGTLWSLGVHVQRTEGTDMLFAGYGRHWRELNAFWDPELIAGKVEEDVRLAKALAPAPTGKVQAVLAPEVLRMMLMPIGLGINGRNVAKGDSPLRGRLGERILSEAITVTDRPHVDYAPGAKKMDGDGGCSRRFCTIWTRRGWRGWRRRGTAAAARTTQTWPAESARAKRCWRGWRTGCISRTSWGSGRAT